MKRYRIQVRANNGFLRQALQGFLAALVGDLTDVFHVLPAGDEVADIVLTVDSSCPPAACLELVGQGASVIVLAAVPRPDSEARYRKAGAAAYLPMEVGAQLLLAALGSVVGGPPTERENKPSPESPELPVRALGRTDAHGRQPVRGLRLGTGPTLSRDGVSSLQPLPTYSSPLLGMPTNSWCRLASTARWCSSP